MSQLVVQQEIEREREIQDLFLKFIKQRTALSGE